MAFWNSKLMEKCCENLNNLGSLNLEIRKNNFPKLRCKYLHIQIKEFKFDLKKGLATLCGLEHGSQRGVKKQFLVIHNYEHMEIFSKMVII